MAIEPTAEDRMDKNFLTFDTSTEISKAKDRLRQENRTIGVYLDDNSKAVSIVCSEGFKPLLKADRKCTLRVIVDSAAILREITTGHPGIIIFEGDKPVGVLRRESLQHYLLNEYRVLTGIAGGAHFKDVELDGVVGEGIPLIRIICATCDTVNELTDFDEGFTMCTHKLPGEHILVKKTN